jgi:hypothetical protein
VTKLPSWATPAAAGGFASGTVMLFFQTAAPTGWTKQTTHNDKALRVVSGDGGGNGGSSAFSTVFGKTATDAHTLDTTQIPAHTHTLSFDRDVTPENDGASIIESTGEGASSATATTNSTGGGGSHTHNIDIRVHYIDVIACAKD